MPTFDEEIARRLQEAADSGELSRAEGYGQPQAEDPGWEATPPALRLPMKILKDAGVAPPEIALFHERARLKASIETTTEPVEREKLQRQLSELEQVIALRLEAIRMNANK
jgi:hypothetical protein